MKDRKTNKVVAKPVPERTKEELQGFISANVSQKAMVYTDDHRSYIGLPFEHESVSNSVGEYVRDMAHTNGVESFWAQRVLRNLPSAMLKSDNWSYFITVCYNIKNSVKNP